MSNQKLNLKDISVGMALPWPVYNAEGKLLLQKGTIIASERQLHGLLERGLYRNSNDVDGRAEEVKPLQDTATPFEILNDMIRRLSGIFSTIILRQGEVQERMYSFCQDLQAVCARHPDAVLGGVHLCHEHPYPLCHPMHVAILVDMFLRREGYSPEKMSTVLAAAITSNIAMLELQEILHHQQEPLTEDQKQQIQEHPALSAHMLRDAGVTDELWLRIVAQHHERPDGTGYHQGLERHEITGESQIVNLADRYAAMVSPRSYRPPCTSKEVLRDLFLKKKQEFDELMIQAFIKELGVFPPGTYVELMNGEKSVVVKRNFKTGRPMVSSVFGMDGRPFALPLRRDTNESKYHIKDQYQPKRSLHMNLNLVWGYNQ